MGSSCSSRSSDHRLATTTRAPSAVTFVSSPSQRPVRRSSAAISSRGSGNSVRRSSRGSSRFQVDVATACGDRCLDDTAGWAALVSVYQADIRELERMTGWDLASWRT